MTANGDIRTPIVLGATPREDLGVRLNVVKRAQFDCPQCGAPGPLEVYVPAVRWSCRHTRSLPPMDISSLRARTSIRRAA
jgi:hypothetical protein